jgi:uncharacterized protein
VKQNAVSFISGLIFSVGLAVSGMTQPQKVIGFLNPWNWDPSLLFVMIGAVAIHALAYPIIRKRPSPLFSSDWHVPTRQDITPKLIVGAAIFGIGWGLGGFCPGPAVTSLASAESTPFLFVGAMIVGMLIFKKVDSKS